MNIIDRFKRLTIWNKIGVIGGICSILSIAIFFISKNFSTKIIIDESPGSIVQTVVDSPGAVQVAGDMVMNVNKQIHLPLKFETTINFLRTTNKKLYDVLYNLPNKKKAFLPVVERGKKYILFYTNEDYSEIYVPEKYKANSDKLNDACWIVTLVRNGNSYGNYLERGPKSYKVDESLSYE